MTNIAFTAAMHLIVAAANQFAERAELDVPTPIEARNITDWRGRTNINHGLTFTVAGRHKFYWQNTAEMEGKFVSYDDLKFSTIYMDREKFLPSLTNFSSAITTNEALQIAERCLHRLGYDGGKRHRVPPIVGQYTHQTSEADTRKPVPLYGIRWLPAKDGDWGDYVFQIQVSGITKKITSFNQLTFEDNTVDLRQFIANSPSKPGELTTNAAPERPHLQQ
jgi:hypothetical protein